MFKKSIYLLIALVIGAFVVFQSCNQNNPITQNESPQQLSMAPLPDGAGNGNFTTPRYFHLSGAGNPVRCDSTNRLELWAGVGNPNVGTKVGYVEFSSVVPATPTTPGSMTVTYIGLPGYTFAAVHFDIEDSLKKIPVNKAHNPVPGHFKYNITVNPPASSKSFNVVLPPIAANTAYFVAAHGEACQQTGGVDALLPLLPVDWINYCVVDKDNDCGYWVLNISGAGAPFDGTNICGWCIDPHTQGLPPGDCNTAHLYSSYDPNIMSYFDPDCSIMYPQNLARVNYLLNKYFPVGTGPQVEQFDYQGFFSIDPNMAMFHDQHSLGTVTMGDLQYAIWYLLDNATGVAPGSTSFNIWGLIYDAYNTYPVNGPQFVPTCGQNMLVIMVPKDNPNPVPGSTACYQPMAFMVPVPCGTGGCGTCWGDAKVGCQFPGESQWATYFKWANNWCPTK